MKTILTLAIAIILTAPVMAQQESQEPEQVETPKKKGKGLKGRLKNTLKAANKNLIEGSGGSPENPSRLTVNEEGVEENKGTEKKK
jgi:hypothetical protein